MGEVAIQYPRKFGKYHLLGPLAQGGMGALYLAVAGDRGLERLMVIKTVLPHLADNEYVARFRDEAKVVVKLSHGNLIPVFDAGVVAGEMFLAMDFVEGRDLRAVWNRCAKKQVAFPIDVAVFVVKELCRGLAYTHGLQELDLVHRDVSPPNVLISFTGEVKLTDFGLASSKLKLEKTQPGIIYGKVAYMSPEQARGEKLDGRSDMYAAGIVLWELLTGRQLFPPGKDQPHDLVTRAKNPDVPAPSKRAPRVPAELDEICLRALRSSREDRYQDCEQMRQALQTWLAKHAPTTDVMRIATFMNELFDDDIVADREARNDLIAGVRKRAMTLPPNDEFRQLVERSSPVTPAEMAKGEAPVRSPGSVGRRADDMGLARYDRRRQSDRRLPADSTPPASNPGVAIAEVIDDEDVNLIGLVVDNRYRIVELIGEGGMGKVYLAEHVEIGRRVAVKVLHPSYGRMPDLVERFRREARAASKIGHPNIVDVTDSGTTPDGSVFFVMEHLDGTELASVIDREGAMDITRSLRIATQICKALAAAHTVGIIHRDLKPENVFLVEKDGNQDFVKVLDFGIAKSQEAEQQRERRLTSPGMAMGTPEYMAPEQAAGRPADARSDIYALGAILYEMLTGRAPYSGDNFMEILTKKATVDPLPADQLRGDLPAVVSDLVMRAMSRNPTLRPQSMETFEYELNKCIGGRGVAVAQILGMTSDPHLAMSLNPGLSGATRAKTPASGAALGLGGGLDANLPSQLKSVTKPPMVMTPRGGSPVANAGANGAVNSAANAALALPVTMPEASSSVAVPTRNSKLATGLLIAALFTGVAALAYVAVGEFSGQSAAAVTAPPAKVVAPSSAQGPTSSVPAVAPNVVAPRADAAPAPLPPPPPSGASGEAAGSATAMPVGTVTPGSVTTPTIKDKPKPGGGNGDAPLKKKPAATELLAEAKRLAGHKETLGEAAGIFAELASYKGMAGTAAYEHAYALFQHNEYEAAAKESQRALEAGYPASQAKLLRADSLLRLRKFDQAKKLYQDLLKSAPDTEAKTRMKDRIAKCNKALGLPAADGTAG